MKTARLSTLSWYFSGHLIQQLYSRCRDLKVAENWVSPITSSLMSHINLSAKSLVVSLDHVKHVNAAIHDPSHSPLLGSNHAFGRTIHPEAGSPLAGRESISFQDSPHVCPECTTHRHQANLASINWQLVQIRHELDVSDKTQSLVSVNFQRQRGYKDAHFEEHLSSRLHLLGLLHSLPQDRRLCICCRDAVNQVEPNRQPGGA